MGFDCSPAFSSRFSFSFVLARVNSLYRVRDGTVTQIVKGDPQWPQSFYPLTTPIEIQNDDYLIGQCVYDNDDENTVRVGYKENSFEMMNFSIVEFVLDQHIKMRCAMSMRCIHLNQRKRLMENKKQVQHLFDHVGIMNLRH